MKLSKERIADVKRTLIQQQNVQRFKGRRTVARRGEKSDAP